VNPTESLQQGIQALTLNLSEDMQQQLLIYVELLAKWNRIYNLTAIRKIDQMIPKHLLDCLAVMPHLQGSNMLDVGSGAGLPGLILAIACPQKRWVLLDSNTKKIRFVRQAVLTLQLNNVEVIQARIEQFDPIQLFDTIICRAFAKLQFFYEQTIHLCAPTGCLLAMKGVYPQAELAEMAELQVEIESIYLKVPQLEVDRHLVVIQKNNLLTI
jgi:16S rRNA (guanine527-N7)-methyltransferase